MKKQVIALACISILAACALATSCRQAVAPASQSITVSMSSGSVSLSFQLPPGMARLSGKGSGRVLDPNTATIKLTAKGQAGGSLSLQGGTRQDGVWTGTFPAVPVGTYLPGEFVVSLLAADSSLLALGSNASNVAISAGPNAAIRITPKPAEALVTDIAFNTKIDVNIPSGSTKYYRLKNLNAYWTFSETFFHPLGSAIVAVIDQDGNLLSDNRGLSAANTVSGTQQDMYRGWHNSNLAGDIYVGVFSQSINQAAFKAEAFVFDDSRQLMGTYYGGDVKDYPNDYGRWPLAADDTVNVTIPPNVGMGYGFRFLNASSSNAAIVFPYRRPVELQTSDPRIWLESQDDFGTVLQGGWEFGFRIHVETGGKGFASTLNTGDTGQATVRIPNDQSADGYFSFTFKYTVGAGAGFANVKFMDQPLKNGATIDAGVYAPGWNSTAPININNDAHGALQLTNLAIEPAGSPLVVNNLPKPDDAAGTSYTLYPWNGFGGAFRIDLSKTSNADIGKTASAKVSFDTNDPLRPKFSFTVKWTIGQPPIKFSPWPGIDPRTSIVLKYDNPLNFKFSSVLGYRIYRAPSWQGPYRMIADLPPPSVTDHSLLYTDTGLTLDSLYYYKIIATVGTASDPAGQTFTSDWQNGASTFDPTKVDQYKKTNGEWTAGWNPHPIALDTLVNPTIYPRRYSDVLSFTPVPGTTYVVTVSNKDMIDALNFTLWYASPSNDSYSDRGEWRWVNSWDRQAQSITWTCPEDYPADQKPWIMVNPNDQAKGSYTVYVRSVAKSPTLLGIWHFDGNVTPAAGVFTAGKAANLSAVADRTAVAGAALYSKGSDTQFYLANYNLPPQLLGSGPKFTGLWFKPDQAKNCIFFMGPQGGEQDGEGASMRFITDGEGNLGIDRSWGTWWSDIKVDVGQWNYVYAGFDGKKWFVGKVVAGTATTATLSDSAPSLLRQGKIALGRDLINGWYSDGAYDSLTIFDGKPSDAAIAAMAQAPDGMGIIQAQIQ